MRLDLYIGEKGLARSREQAKELIKSGKAIVDGKVISKPSFDVTEANSVEISGDTLKYVGRGGLKLEKAISEFGIDLDGKVCIDIGASTGGFTDCMLQNGAALVYAVDVGHGQLDEKLINDSRVISMEGSDIRKLTADSFKNKPDLISADVSFISLRLILPKISEFLPESGEAVVLIKPQFEAGRSAVGKNGIVKDRKAHIRVLEEITSFCPSAGLSVQKIVPSPIAGGSGNREYLAYLKKGEEGSSFDFEKIVSSAFNEVY